MSIPHRYPELEQARADMREQSELYRPTVFWDEASSRIVREINEHGVDCFRAQTNMLGFFVPTYGVPGNSFTHEQAGGLRDWLETNHPLANKAQLGLNQFLSGDLQARSDYRTLVAADDPLHLPHLHHFSESSVGEPIEHFEYEGRKFSRTSLNYLLGLALLKKHLGDECPRTVMEIGAGYGTLGEILASSGIEGLRYIDIDIPPTSYVAQHYLSAVFGASKVATYAQTRELDAIQIGQLPPFSVLCSWQIEKLRGEVDLFVNFISFQEMEPHIVQNYLAHVKRLGARWVLLRNMLEGKQKHGEGHWAGVKTPILGNDYPPMLPGYELVERNVLPFGYRTVDGYHSELLLLRKV
jgi:putative sugar O-methyltransferase